MGDREARYGVSFGLSDLGGAATPSISLWGNLDQSRCQLVALIEPYGWGMLEDGGRTREYAGTCSFDA